MSWDLVQLSDVCDIAIGRTPARKKPAYWGNGFPWVSISDMNASKRISKTKEQITALALTETKIPVVPKDTVLYSFKLSIGKVCISDCDIYTNEAIASLHIKNKENLDFNYLSYVMKSIRVNNSDRAVMGQTLNKNKLNQIKIPLPPLPEQKRIASILDAADTLRTKRRQAIAMLDELLQATFLDMFGDPVANPKGWDVKKLGDFVEKLLGGKNIAQAEYVSSFKVLKVSAVTSGIYKPEESKYLPDDYQFPAEYLVHKNDLLISRANTTELIGATAFVWDTPENIVLPDKIWKFVWKNIQEINPLFVFAYTNQADFRRQVSNRCSGTSGSMKNIAKPKLLSIPIYVPPLTLQTQFANIVEKVEAQKAVQQAHLAELDTLFASLQQRAFVGAL